jgi:hypothetical protein
VRWLASLGALLLSLPRPVLAADTQSVSLLLPGCELPGVSAGELRRAVALELQSEGLILSPAGDLSPDRDAQVLVEATCSAPDELTLRAQHGVVHQSRVFRLSELAVPQRPRALALSISELASLVLHPPALKPMAREPLVPEPEDEPTPAVKPPPAAAPAAPAAPASALSPASAAANPSLPIEAAWRLALVPELRFFSHTSLWGARAQLERARFRYTVGLLASLRQAPAGSVWTRLAQVSAAYAFPLSGEARRSLIETGPRLGLGYAFMSARAAADATATDARDWYADVAWALRYSTTVSRSVRLGLGAELGYGRGPIGYAGNVVIAQTSGPFASLLLEGSLLL